MAKLGVEGLTGLERLYMSQFLKFSCCQVQGGRKLKIERRTNR